MGFGRTFLYHSSAPQGKIFEGQDAIEQALKDGWKEAPWLVGEELQEPEPEKQADQRIAQIVRDIRKSRKNPKPKVNKGSK